MQRAIRLLGKAFWWHYWLVAGLFSLTPAVWEIVKHPYSPTLLTGALIWCVLLLGLDLGMLIRLVTFTRERRGWN